jgi:hypothetical protein
MLKGIIISLAMAIHPFTFEMIKKVWFIVAFRTGHLPVAEALRDSI